MPSPTPAPRLDVEGIEARARKSVARALDSSPWLGELVAADIPALIAYIKALEARMLKLEAVAAAAREALDETEFHKLPCGKYQVLLKGASTPGHIKLRRRLLILGKTDGNR